MLGTGLLALLLTAPGAQADVDDAAILAPRPPSVLSQFGFFDDAQADVPAKGVVPYTVTASLFTDYAQKDRYIYAPSPAAYQIDTVLDFPVGSALIKTFSYGDRKIETRVMLHRPDGWTAFPYVWNEAGTEAQLKIAGKDLLLQTEFGKIDYHVPNFNQCKACHVSPENAFLPIGPKIRNLNSQGQLQQLVVAGIIAQAPENAPVTPDYMDDSVDLELRARAYLDANCGHCHAPGLPADTSGLYLNWEEDRPIHLGVNKPPVAAGRGSGGRDVAIKPGDPDASILHYRIVSTDPGEMMPEIGRTLVHVEGVALIAEYIRSLADN
ncbi:MAG: SO2930 family diheme c-type cytochrome [Paracoccaceae bacterium]